MSMNYIGKKDSEYMLTEDYKRVRNKYIHRFGGDSLPMLNYFDFQAEGDKCAAQVYKETLEKCLAENRPYDIPSKWHPEKQWEDFFKSRGEWPDDKEK